MKPTLSIFLDGIGYDSLKHMDFLSSFNNCPIEPILGYSVTCHASMYTGLYPIDHGLFFIWGYSPDTSPFKGIQILNSIRFLDNKYIKYIICKIINNIKNYKGYFGIPRIEYLPYKYWNLFDVIEKQFWTDDKYLYPNETIFDIAKKNEIKYEIIGMDRSLKREANYVKSRTIPREKDWIYLFIGDIDYYTHRFGKDSLLLRTQLKRIDNIIKSKYDEMKMKYNDFNFHVWSDHGHITIEEHIDIYYIFETFGYNLNDFIHIIEATAARFWFRNEKERDIVGFIMNKVTKGKIINDRERERFGVMNKDHRFGDLIYFLDPGFIFEKTIWGNNKWQRSMHGYWPDAPGYQALFCSNMKIALKNTADLTNIFSTLCKSLELPIPNNVLSKSLV